MPSSSSVDPFKCKTVLSISWFFRLALLSSFRAYVSTAFTFRSMNRLRARRVTIVKQSYVESLNVPQEPRRRKLYTATAPISEGKLDVGHGHTLDFRIYGQESGPTALFLHGGPGAGCFPNHARFFDPTFYRIVLFDQRGCGKSTPRGSLLFNDTPSLVGDIEVLRKQLGIDRWHCVLGGSWGVALALSYAKANPERVRALVLRGLCLMRSQEIDYLFGDKGAASTLYPEHWARFVRFTNFSVADLLPNGRKVLNFYHEQMLGNVTALRDQAVCELGRWEMAVASGRRVNDEHDYSFSKPFLSRDLVWDGVAWSVRPISSDPTAVETMMRSLGPNLPMPSIAAPAKTISSSEWESIDWPSTNSAQTLLTTHFSVFNGFLENSELLVQLATPCIAVQGARDPICPPSTALELHRVWPQMRLRIIGDAGHSMYDPGITSSLVEATDFFRYKSDFDFA